MAQRKHPSSPSSSSSSSSSSSPPPKRLRRSIIDDHHDDAAAISETVSQQPKNRYDIFLSFRGEDTRQGFTGHLYDALCRRGFEVFIDDEELRTGERISSALLTAIEESRISIVVFSQNYASSTWCLDELVKILKCRNQLNQQVWPIFYKVEPSDVRHQRNSYAQAMAAHQDRFRNDLDKLQEWRSALCEASNLSGLSFSTGYEYEFIERIVERASDFLPKPLYVGEHTVGLQSQVEEVMSLLDIQSTNTICMVGIHGTGGIGKTTLGRALYNSIVHRFVSACYLADVRERSNQSMGLVHLQETLLSKVSGIGVKLSDDAEGAFEIKRRLCHHRVLLVLDDVDHIRQLENLVGNCDWFGHGSRIIVTTRDKQVLKAHQVENRYEMKVLNNHDSLELFCWNAFKRSCPKIGYEDMSNHIVNYAKGLPLALKVIGSNLIGKDLEEWKCALDEYEKIQHEEIQSILRISYDSLDYNKKNIFLDIACFCKGKELTYVESILDGCGFNPKYGIGVLVDKSLIAIEDGKLRMHDLIQDMGREVIRQEDPSEPGMRSRIWFHKDVIEVLEGNSGSNKIQGLILDPPQQEEVEWNGTAFQKMHKLRILIIKNACFSQGPTHLPNSLRLLDWNEYPSESFPPDFYPSKIVVFNLCNSRLTGLLKPSKKYDYLTMMDFSDCEFITHIPDMSIVPNIRELKAQKCHNLVEVHDSVGFLSKLVSLDVSGCMNLSRFPRAIHMASLSFLELNRCISLEHFPDILGKMDALTCIRANDTAIEELPHSIGNLTGLSQLELRSNTRLRQLPSSLFMLQNLCWFHFIPSPNMRKSIAKCLRQLSFQFYRKFPKEYCLGQEKNHHAAVICCPKLVGFTLPNCGLLDTDLHLILNCFPNLVILDLSGNDFISLPQCIEQLHKLRMLDVSNCKKLQHISHIPSNLKKIKAQNCTSLTTESSNRLWSQVKKEVHELEITMPERGIPDWFDHRCEGETVCFSIRGKFPLFALAFSFGKVNATGVEKSTVDISFCVNGRLVIRGNKSSAKNPMYSSICMSSDPIREGNALLWTPRGSLEEEDWQQLDDLLVHDDWNEVVIQAKCSDDSCRLTVSHSAVYVCKPQTNMEDVQFKCFDPNNNSSTMLAMTVEPIRLKGSQASLERYFVEGLFHA